ENADKQIEIMAIGRKGRDFFRSRHATISSEYIGLTGKGRVELSEALDVANSLVEQYTEDTAIDKVYIVYNEFKSVLSQRVVLDQILPVARPKEAEPENRSQEPVTLIDYIYEQPPEELFGRLLPRLIE